VSYERLAGQTGGGARRRTLARRRRTRGYSQEALAEAVGVDRATVARWEAGQTEPQPWHRRKIATTLDVSLEELETLLCEATGTPRHQAGHRHPDHPLPRPAAVRRRAVEILTAHTIGRCSQCQTDGCPRLAHAATLLI
jgi:transcriptional regulator with XRE-family HTH domain